MADVSRLESLRRRVEEDPASIAFAQLAEELRRAGRYREAIHVCRTGLARHREYLSARVTLGRALIEVNDLDAAKTELGLVIRGAPENLAAIRGLAEIHHRQGDQPRALLYYRQAFALAPSDPELQKKIAALTESGTQATGPGVPDSHPLPDGRSAPARPFDSQLPDARPSPAVLAAPDGQLSPAPEHQAVVLAFPPAGPQARVADLEAEKQLQGLTPTALNSPERRRAERTVVALEKWLTAIERLPVKHSGIG